MKKLITILLTILMIGTVMTPFSVMAAGPEVKILLTGPATVENGKTVNVEYWLDISGANITVADVYFGYDSSDLQFVSFTKAPIANWTISHNDYGAGPFAGIKVEAANPMTGPSVPITGKKLIGTFTFKVLAAVGKTVTVQSGNMFISEDGVSAFTNIQGGSWSAKVVAPSPDTYGITVTNDGNGTAKANVSSAKAGDTVTLTATPNSGYTFKSWQVISGGVSVSGNKFTMPSKAVSIKAIFEKTAAPSTPPTSTPPTSTPPATSSAPPVTSTPPASTPTTSEPVTSTPPPSQPSGTPPAGPIGDINIGGGYPLYPPFDPNDPDLTDFVLLLPDDVKELDLSVLPIDPNKPVEIIGADDLEPGINIIKIIVTDDDGSVKEYTIAAIVGGDGILPDGGTANLLANCGGCCS